MEKVPSNRRSLAFILEFAAVRSAPSSAVEALLNVAVFPHPFWTSDPQERSVPFKKTGVVPGC
jgi:hypothetical protein